MDILHKIFNSVDTTKLAGVLVVVGIVTAGCTVVLVSRAATPFLAAEPENGTITSPAATIGDSSASSGHAVKFQSADTGTPTVPAPAAEAGYTSLTFHDDFNSISTIDFTGNATAGQGYNWTVQQPFSNDAPVVTTGNTTVANSILTLRQTTDNYNQGIFTTNRATHSNLAGPFQYGYYEARMKFDPTKSTAAGWPSFWSIGASHALLTNTTRWPELDFFEFAADSQKASGGVYAASIHDHDASSGTDQNYWNKGNNTVDVNPASWNDWHTYGCLWQPGSIKWYFDGVLINTQTYTATTQSPTAIVNATGVAAPAGAYTVLDDPVDGPATLVLGTGVNSPLQVDWVRVWH